MTLSEHAPNYLSDFAAYEGTGIFAVFFTENRDAMNALQAAMSELLTKGGPDYRMRVLDMTIVAPNGARLMFCRLQPGNYDDRRRVIGYEFVRVYGTDDPLILSRVRAK